MLALCAKINQVKCIIHSESAILLPALKRSSEISSWNFLALDLKRVSNRNAFKDGLPLIWKQMAVSSHRIALNLITHRKLNTTLKTIFPSCKSIWRIGNFELRRLAICIVFHYGKHMLIYAFLECYTYYILYFCPPAFRLLVLLNKNKYQ